MNAAVTPQPAGSFLPEITTNATKPRRGSGYRMYETTSASDKFVQTLSKKEIARFRTSLKQHSCVEMLQDGCHRSFSELFLLLRSDQDRRAAAAAEPDSAVELPASSLEEQRDKLETMRLHLSRAEQAERKGSWSTVCEHRLLLGRFFSAPEDLWLRLHFYHSCAEREDGGRSRPATEARAHLAEYYLQRGDLEPARRQAELCLQQAEDGGWLDSDGRPLKLRACRALWRIYSRLADALLTNGDCNRGLSLLHRGHSMAAESGDRQCEADAAYRLGLTYQRSGDHDTAKQWFSACMQIYGTLQDSGGLVKAYEATVESSRSEGNMDETVQVLEKLVDVSRSNGLTNTLANACLRLGDIYYAGDQYSRAHGFFLQAYEVACGADDVTLLQKAQVKVTAARAASLIRKHSAIVASTSPAARERLLVWKEARGHQDGDVDPADHYAAAWN